MKMLMMNMTTMKNPHRTMNKGGIYATRGYFM